MNYFTLNHMLQQLLPLRMNTFPAPHLQCVMKDESRCSIFTEQRRCTVIDWKNSLYFDAKVAIKKKDKSRSHAVFFFSFLKNVVTVKSRFHGL